MTNRFDPTAPQSPPPGGVDLVARVTGRLVGRAMAMVAAGPAGTAIRLTATQRPPNPWDVQLQFPASAGVRKGDTLLVRFKIRALKGQAETSEGRTSVVLERGEPPWGKALDQEIPATKVWKEWLLPCTAGEDIPAGKVNLNFRLGYGAQILEIRDVALLHYGASLPIARLPRTKLGYAGSEPGATWRAEADARIEKHRKANLTVEAVDAKTGRPLPGAQVALAQTRHAFAFGTAVAGDALFMTGPDGDRYRQTLTTYFNRATIENHLKWPFWEAWGKRDGLRALDWLVAHGMEVRGHVLVWPAWRNLPPDLPGLAKDKAALTRRVERHIAEVAGACKGKIVEWDVVNETFDNHDITDALGRDSLVRWFKRARQADPKARLTLNDYPPLDGAEKGNAHLEHFEDTLKFLKARDAPIGGLGFQCHFGSSPIPPRRLLAGLDRFAKLNLPIALTEFDIDTNDEALQADYTRDFLTAAFSHPAVDSITGWGFWERRHWAPRAAFWRADWSLRPAGRQFVELTRTRWWTRANGATDARGRFAARGFLGRYTATVTVGGKKVTKAFALGKGGATVRVAV